MLSLSNSTCPSEIHKAEEIFMYRRPIRDNLRTPHQCRFWCFLLDLTLSMTVGMLLFSFSVSLIPASLVREDPLFQRISVLEAG